MKTITTIALFLCSIGVSAQKLTFANPETNAIAFQVNGIAKATVIDTVYAIEDNIPVRTIQKVYTLKDSTKYTERYKAQYNDKKDYWDFKSVSFNKGVVNNYIQLGNSWTWPNGITTTPNYKP
jgi:hypothetical protein